MIPVCILAIEDESDRAFMENLFLQYNRLMYHEIFKITNDTDITDDVLQSTLEKLIDKIQKLRTLDRNRLVNYIITASKNTALNYLRDQKTGQQVSFDDCIDSPDLDNDKHSTEDRLILLEEWDQLRIIWPKLDERSKYLLESRYLLEKSNQEMAQYLGIKPESIRMALTRARKNAVQLWHEELELKK